MRKLGHEEGYAKGYQAALDDIDTMFVSFDSNDLAKHSVWYFIEVFRDKIQELKEKQNG